jgi:tetratricopeptide (TPR) repeat protein
MSLTVRLREIKLASVQHDWACIKQAHHQIRQMKIRSAASTIQRIKENFKQYFFEEPVWSESDDPESFSFSRACIYLFDHFWLSSQLSDWQTYLDAVLAHPEHRSIPVVERLRLNAYAVWVYANTAKRNDSLHSLLKELVSLEGDSLTRYWHHFALGWLYHVDRSFDESLYHLHEAGKLVNIDHEPFYTIRILEFTGATYLLQKNCERALQSFVEVDHIARAFGEEAESETQPYNLGWVYSDLGRHSEAIREFQRGQEKARRLGIEYDYARNLYGESIALQRVNEAKLALEKAHEALRFFYGATGGEVNNFSARSPNMTATCLLSIALAHEQLGEKNKARHYGERALQWHSLGGVENPTQKGHIQSLLNRV